MSAWTIAGIVLSGALVVATPFIWRRRGAAFGLRWLAVGLLPAGLALAGLLSLFGRIGNAIASFVSRFVFSPAVWVGYVVIALAVVLWVVARFVGSRTSDRTARTSSEERQPAVPAVTASGGSRSADDDFSDVEELLRRRGIK